MKKADVELSNYKISNLKAKGDYMLLNEEKPKPILYQLDTGINWKSISGIKKFEREEEEEDEAIIKIEENDKNKNEKEKKNKKDEDKKKIILIYQMIR